jgi:hypothetical protein
MLLLLCDLEVVRSIETNASRPCTGSPYPVSTRIAASDFLGLLTAGYVVDSTNFPVWFLLAGIVSAIVGVSGFFIGSVLNIEQVSASPQAVMI